jgi:hypothetical protein
VVFHYNGIRWEKILGNYRCGMVAVGGRDAGQVFVLTACGDILVYQRKQWVALEGQAASALYGLWVPPRGQKAFVCGDGGAILQLNLQPPAKEE